MDLSLVKKTVSRIRSSLFKNSNSFSIGMLKSHFRGQGLQFKEHQVYIPGDDIRFIDWKLIAKTNNSYIKTFEEERNVEIMVLLDASPTMLMGYNGISKLQAAIEVCCLLYFLSHETKDYIHTIIIHDDVTVLPKATGESGATLFISELIALGIITSKGEVNIQRQFNYIADMKFDYNLLLKHILKKREIVILSDLINLFDESVLKRIIYQRHIHCFKLLSPLDEVSRIPYTVSGIFNGKHNYTSVYSDELIDLESKFGKRVKKLRVDSRYIEEFVKEML